MERQFTDTERTVEKIKNSDIDVLSLRGLSDIEKETSRRELEMNMEIQEISWLI